MRYLTFVLLAVFFTCNAQVERSKIVDEGGSGPYPAFAVTESTLRNFVIYRPQNLHESVKKSGQLPVIIFANGGCSDTSLEYERILTELASHAYIVIALGEMLDSFDDRPQNTAPNSMIIEGLDWISAQAQSKNSEYFQMADLRNVAFAGHSCGGAQILAVANDPRVDTFMMFNSGMGEMTMADASKASLQNVHVPIIYIVGGQTDIAAANAELDYQYISHVPVALANLPNGGHSGTFNQAYGGTFGKLALVWLDWRLKNKVANAAIFLDKDSASFTDWQLKAKNFIGQ